VRRGELLSLKWNDIDFRSAILTVRGDKSKSGKTRHIPLNSEVFKVLQDWKKQATNSDIVFSGRDQNPMKDMRKSWARVLGLANIYDFRWHDLRHHFTSKLVMAGVDLNTVRELLGHADVTMTLRYAHLAPEHKANAVAKLVRNELVTTA
jgi:integrase